MCTSQTNMSAIFQVKKSVLYDGNGKGSVSQNKTKQTKKQLSHSIPSFLGHIVQMVEKTSSLELGDIVSMLPVFRHLGNINMIFSFSRGEHHPVVSI